MALILCGTPSFPSDQKCTEAQNEQSCAFEQKERQILFCEWKKCLLYIGGEVEVHEGGEGLMVEKKMVERVVLKKEKVEKVEKVVWFKLWFLYCWREDCRLISSIPRSAAFQTWKRYDWWILNCYTVNFKRINFQTLPSRQFCVFQIHAISLGIQVESWIHVLVPEPALQGPSPISCQSCLQLQVIGGG